MFKRSTTKDPFLFQEVTIRGVYRDDYVWVNRSASEGEGVMPQNFQFLTVLVIAAFCEWYVIVFRRDLWHIPLSVNRQLNLGKDRGHAARLVNY